MISLQLYKNQRGLQTKIPKDQDKVRNKQSDQHIYSMNTPLHFKYTAIMLFMLFMLCSDLFSVATVDADIGSFAAFIVL